MGAIEKAKTAIEAIKIVSDIYDSFITRKNKKIEDDNAKKIKELEEENEKLKKKLENK